MGTTRRTQVDAIDDLAKELRTANLLRALEMGGASLEHDDGKRATSDLARERVARRNAMRAEVGKSLGIEG